jgi:tryptophanyl-tRNA synthetase
MTIRFSWAADILLYDTEVVPVGDDQLQHVELARDLAKRFNNQYGQTFVVPRAEIRKEGARIMGLDNPTKKMSKSSGNNLNYIALTDDVSLAKKKIIKAETDSGSEVRFDPINKPGISNLLVIESLLSKTSIKDLEKKYAGMLYGDFKKGVAETVGIFLEDFQSRYNEINDADVQSVLDNGAKQVRLMAEKIMKDIRKKVGVK